MNANIIPIESISSRIYLIRGMKVMLDSDLAELYGVPTKRLNEQVRRNASRFPSDFMFRLSTEELKHFNRSQFATGSSKASNLSQFAIGSQKHRDPKLLPYAFTEHGVAMLSSVLRSPQAVEMNIFIIRAFIRLREILSSNKELADKVREIEREQRLQNRHINSIYDMLSKLMKEPVKAKEPIGFRK